MGKAFARTISIGALVVLGVGTTVLLNRFYGEVPGPQPTPNHPGIPGTPAPMPTPVERSADAETRPTSEPLTTPANSLGVENALATALDGIAVASLQSIPAMLVWAAQPDAIDNVLRIGSSDGRYDAFLSVRSGAGAESRIEVHDTLLGSTFYIKASGPRGVGDIETFIWKGDDNSIVYSAQYADSMPPNPTAGELSVALHYALNEYSIETRQSRQIEEIPAPAIAIAASGSKLFVATHVPNDDASLALRLYGDRAKSEQQIFPTGAKAQKIQILPERNEIWFTTIERGEDGVGRFSLNVVELEQKNPIPRRVLEDVVAFGWDRSVSKLVTLQGKPTPDGKSINWSLNYSPDRDLRHMTTIAQSSNQLPVPVGFDRQGETIYLRGQRKEAITHSEMSQAGTIGIWEYKVN